MIRNLDKYLKLWYHILVTLLEVSICLNTKVSTFPTLRRVNVMQRLLEQRVRQPDQPDHHVLVRQYNERLNMPKGVAGRPNSLEKAEQDRKVLARKMRQGLIVGMSLLSEDYGEIMRGAIEDAKEGDKYMRKLLLELPFKMDALMDDTDEGAFAKLRERWTYERIKQGGQSQEAEDTGPTVSVEHRAIN